MTIRRKLITAKDTKTGTPGQRGLVDHCAPSRSLPGDHHHARATQRIGGSRLRVWRLRCLRS